MKKQLSKESLHSTTNTSGVSGPTSVPPTIVDEEVFNDDTITPTQAPENFLPNSSLIHRNPSLTSFAGEAKLGRIQLTLRYSVPRQKLVIVIHKIAYVFISSPFLNNKIIKYLQQFIFFPEISHFRPAISTIFRIHMLSSIYFLTVTRKQNVKQQL